MFENLLVTKLYIPSLTINHVTRPRLFQLLDEGLRLGQWHGSRSTRGIMTLSVFSPI